MKLQFAKLDFSDSTAPISTNFNDVYFSKEDGVAESEYVFIGGNNLIKQWHSCKTERFTIGETGFGTGLNVALTIDKFLTFRKENPNHLLKQLHFISFELHPIAPGDLQKISASWPNFHQTYESLIDAYPPNLAGIYRIELHKNVATLDLVLGDINQSINTLCDSSAAVNAWFLDGFAPSKNEAMWKTTVFKQMQRLSRIGTTLATFTSAGFVKRGLEAAGFRISKISGFGRKREMITGVLETQSKSDDPQYFLRSGSRDIKHCAVVGAGIAGLVTSLALLKRGISVELICKNELGDGASGNLVAGFYPQLQAEYSLASQFYWQCFDYAYHFYKALAEEHPFDHQFDGALLLGFNEKQAERFTKMEKRELWPDDFARIVNSFEASEIAGLTVPHGGLYINKGGWISPIDFINATFDKCKSYDNFNYHANTHVTEFDNNGANVSISLKTSTEKHRCVQADAMVIAAGADTPDLLREFDFRLTRGQVEFLPTSEKMNCLKALICHKGYFTPSYKGFHALGSTYVKGDTEVDVRKTDTLTNLKTHLSAMPESYWQEFINDSQQKESAFSRASIRCSTPDHLPLIGNIPDFKTQRLDFAPLSMGKHSCKLPANIYNCFMISGLGSRGFTSAPLCAEILASQITQQPLPLGSPLLDALNPNRFLIRQLKRPDV